MLIGSGAPVVVQSMTLTKTHDVEATTAQIAALTPGSQTKLKVLREKKAVEFDVTVGKRPKARAS